MRQEGHRDELLCDETVRESLCFQSPVRTRTRTRTRAEAGSCSSHLLVESTKESDHCDQIVVMLVAWDTQTLFPGPLGCCRCRGDACSPTMSQANVACPLSSVCPHSHVHRRKRRK